MELLKRQNHMFITGLQRLNFEFSEFLPLLNSDDNRVIFAVLELFVHLASIPFLGSYHAPELQATMLLLCNPRSFNLEFSERLLKFILPFGDIIEGRGIPFFLLSLLYLTSTDSGRLLIPLSRALQQAPSVFTQFSEFFILFLLHIHTHSEDIGFVRNSMRIVAWQSLLSPGAGALSNLIKFSETVSAKLEIDFSPFLRIFLTEALALCPLPLGDCPNAKQKIVFSATIRFISQIPHFDSFFHTQFTPIPPVRQSTRDFQRLLGVFYINGSIHISYAYATRITYDGYWLDADLAAQAFDICRRPLEWEGIALAMATGLAHFRHAERFLPLAELFFTAGPSTKEEQRRALWIVLGGLVRASLTPSPPSGLAALLHTASGVSIEKTVACDAIVERAARAEAVIGRIFTGEDLVECAELAQGSDVAGMYG
jgi:hypothetical protein